MCAANSSTDLNDLETMYAQLRLAISGPRVERRAGRSQGVWNEDKSLVQITKKEGKFENFGHYIDNQLYLEYYEALYLLELGRLQLNKHGLVLSIEQAYILLLGELPTPKCNEYLVYSCLSRAGYILVPHSNKFFSTTFTQTPNEIDCIWAWLFNAVGNRAVPNYIKKTEMYAKIKEQIEQTKLKIIEQQASDPTQDDEEKEDETLQTGTPIKRFKLEDKGLVEDQRDSYQKNEALWPPMDKAEKSFLNILMTEPEFKQFEQVFQKFDIIKLRTAKSFGENNNNNNNLQNFSINFDLYLHNTGFKRSVPLPPVMRVLILDSKQSFPNHREVSRCCKNLFYSTPLLIVSVGDAKQIQAFLYLFT